MGAGVCSLGTHSSPTHAMGGLSSGVTRARCLTCLLPQGSRNYSFPSFAQAGEGVGTSERGISEVQCLVGRYIFVLSLAYCCN